MTTIQIQHAVRDFEAWKQAFDSDPLRRGKHGVVRHVVQRSIEDPNFIVIQLEFGTRAEAEIFLPLLRGMFGGVADVIGFGPEGAKAWILEDAERVDY